MIVGMYLQYVQDFLFVKWLKCDLKMQYTDSTPLSQLLQIDANFTCLQYHL